MSTHCPNCGADLKGPARFCTDCGSPIADAPAGATPVQQPAAPQIPVDEQPTASYPQPQQGPYAGQPTAAWDTQAYAAPPAPPVGPPPGVYMPYPQPPQQPPPSTGNRGLIVGLAGALAVAVAGIVAAVLLTSGGTDNTPTVAAAAAAATQQAAAPTRTVVTIVEKAAKSKSTSSSTSTEKSSSLRSPNRNVSRRSTSSAGATASSASVERVAVAQVVRAHWSNIESGNYAAAFSALAPGTQSQSSWISAHEQDGLTSASISLGTPTMTSATTATVPVLSLRTNAASGCNIWSGHYEMVNVGGSWKINKAKISNSSC
jgi:hypothetical protein